MSAAIQQPYYLEQSVPRSAPVRPHQLMSEVQQPPRKPPTSSGLQHGIAWNKKQIQAESPLKILDQLYVIEDRAAVLPFIGTNRLRGLLLDAAPVLERAFGDTTKILTVIRDDEGVESLFCYVLTRSSVQQARQALRVFDTDWWIQRCARAEGKLNFDFELI
jgi:hypothetical protein